MDKQTYFPNLIKNIIISILLIFLLITKNNNLMFIGFFLVGFYITTTISFIREEHNSDHDILLLKAIGIAIPAGIVIGVIISLILSFSFFYSFLLCFYVSSILEIIISLIIHIRTKNYTYRGSHKDFVGKAYSYIAAMVCAIIMGIGIVFKNDGSINFGYIGLGGIIGVLLSEVVFMITDNYSFKRLTTIIGIAIYAITVFLISFLALEINVIISLLLMGFSSCMAVVSIYYFAGMLRAILANIAIFAIYFSILGFEPANIVLAVLFGFALGFDLVRVMIDHDSNTRAMLGFNILLLIVSLIIGAICHFNNSLNGIIACAFSYVILDYVIAAMFNLDFSMGAFYYDNYVGDVYLDDDFSIAMNWFAGIGGFLCFIAIYNIVHYSAFYIALIGAALITAIGFKELIYYKITNKNKTTAFIYKTVTSMVSLIIALIATSSGELGIEFGVAIYGILCGLFTMSFVLEPYIKKYKQRY